MDRTRVGRGHGAGILQCASRDQAARRRSPPRVAPMLATAGGVAHSDARNWHVLKAVAFPSRLLDGYFEVIPRLMTGVDEVRAKACLEDGKLIPLRVARRIAFLGSL